MIDKARQGQLARAADDHAARYAWPHHPLVNDPVRYVAEGHVPGGTTGWEWEWVSEYLRHHPEILTRQPLTLAQLDDRDRREAEQRRNLAGQLAGQAREAYDAGDPQRALAFVDDGERLDPAARNWPRIRALITGAR
ncbi:hypothetical protein [Micromonospora haikouensis]|uniref:hypothetical protein n=1 Tax=Micromonospora haikouensis TaxID=686309 RepID=UPI003D7265EE